MKQRKFFLTTLLLTGSILLCACGDNTTDYIAAYSKELSAAFGDYTYTKTEETYSLLAEGAPFGNEKYWVWKITYSAPDGTQRQDTIRNLYEDEPLSEQINAIARSNVEESLETQLEALTDAYYAKCMTLTIDFANEPTLSPAHTTLETLVTENDCTLSIGLDYGITQVALETFVSSLCEHCGNRLNLCISMDFLGKPGFDAAADERYVDILRYEKGERTFQALSLLSQDS